MARKTRRAHSSTFKAKVALAAIRGDRALAELGQPFELHPNPITDWKRQLSERAADVFDGRGGSDREAPPVDLKALHAKTGQLTLENDFLEGALSQVGLLSATR